MDTSIFSPACTRDCSYDGLAYQGVQGIVRDLGIVGLDQETVVKQRVAGLDARVPLGGWVGAGREHRRSRSRTDSRPKPRDDPSSWVRRLTGYGRSHPTPTEAAAVLEATVGGSLMPGSRSGAMRCASGGRGGMGTVPVIQALRDATPG